MFGKKVPIDGDGNLSYILSQKICIFYKDVEWRKKLHQKILEYYSKFDYILKYNSNTIYFKDGGYIIFKAANENARGGCYTKIIMQSGIDYETITQVIKPQLKPFNMEIIAMFKGEEICDNNL